MNIIPSVGSEVRVVIQSPNYNIFTSKENPKQQTVIAGRVIRPLAHVAANNFCVATGNPQFPVSVISIKNCVEIKVLSGNTNTIKTFEVRGSKGSVYTVTKAGQHFSCTCPGFKFHGGKCKHISQIKNS